MKSDISGRQKVEPIFNIFLLFIFFRILHTRAMPAMPATASNFLLHLHGRKHFGSKYIFIIEMFVCCMSVAFCPHIYTYTLLPKACLHLDGLAGCPQRHFHWCRSWSHQPLETSVFDHFAQNGDLPNAGFFWNQLYTAQVFLMPGWRIEFPLKAYMLIPAWMSPGPFAVLVS